MTATPPRFPTGTGLLAENPFLEMLARAPRQSLEICNLELLLVRVWQTRSGRDRLLAALVIGYAIQILLIANWWSWMAETDAIMPTTELIFRSAALIAAFFLFIGGWCVSGAVWIILPVKAAGAMITERGKHTLPLAAITALRPRQFLVGLLGARTIVYWVAVLAFVPALIANPLNNLAGVRDPGYLTVAHLLGSLTRTASWLVLMVLGTMVAFLIGIRFRSMAIALPVALLLLYLLSLVRDLGEFLIAETGGFDVSLIAYLAIAVVVCSLWRRTEQQFDEDPEHYVT